MVFIPILVIVLCSDEATSPSPRTGELLYYPQAKIYDHTLLTKQSYAFDA